MCVCVRDDREQWVCVDQFDGDGPRGPDIAQPQRWTRHHSWERHCKILESLCEEAWDLSIISSEDKKIYVTGVAVIILVLEVILKPVVLLRLVD